MNWNRRKKLLKEHGWMFTRIGHDNFYTHYSNIYFVADLREMEDDEFMLIVEEG